MPFLTEELWHSVAPLAGKTGKTIMLQAYPQPQASQIDTHALQEMDWSKQFIMGVRRIRSEMNIAPSKPLPILLQNASVADKQKWQDYQTLITHLARLDSVTWLDKNANAPESAIALVAEMRILIPLAGLIDKEAELKRLQKEIDKLTKELAKSTAKLDNPKFTQRAPAEVVEKEQQRVAEMKTSLQQLEAQASKIRTI